jgi:hypothetical protein
MRTFLSALIPICLSSGLFAQDNYEIQVYPSETVAPGHTMFEIHSNYTIDGSKEVADGVLPTEHAWHETLEVTQGWSSWAETGLYLFSSINPGYGWQYAGSHVRPRVRAPAAWHWPVGASISFEFGYVRPEFSADTWTLEIRPILDKQYKRWYAAFNPTFDRSFHGPGVNQGLVFSPNVKVGYDFTKRISGGFEYYGSLGPVTGFDPIGQQEQQLFPVIDLNLGPNWECNFGVGIGLTGATDHLLVKLILGRRFNWSRR